MPTHTATVATALSLLAGLVAAILAGWKRWLPWIALILLFSRIKQSRLLDHPLRAQIMQLVRNQPGIHCHALARQTGRSNSTIQHHLAILARAGLLNEHRWKGSQGYSIANDPDRTPFPVQVALRKPVARRIWDTLQKHPGASLAQVAVNLRLPRTTVARHVRRFKEAGMMPQNPASEAY